MFKNILVVFLVCFVVTGLSAQENTKDISGTIVDSQTKIAIGEVSIWIVATDILSISNFAGNYKIPSVTTGEHIILFEKDGYMSQLMYFAVNIDSTINSNNIELEKISDSLLVASNDNYDGTYLVVDTASYEDHNILFVVPEFVFFERQEYLVGTYMGQEYSKSGFNYRKHKNAEEAFFWMAVLIAPKEPEVYPRNVIVASKYLVATPYNPWCCGVITSKITVSRFIQPSEEYNKLRDMVRAVRERQEAKEQLVAHFLRE
ncbi:MAG: carboxypeptidase-like regulatory domain-containing protein [Candidatus Kerfeldbacteria bacterium]